MDSAVEESAAPSPRRALSSATRLGRAEWLGLAALLAVALALRLLHLFEIRTNDPFFEAPSVDPRLYHEWATRIAGGDWVGEEAFFLGPLYPYLLGVVYTIFGPSLLAAKLTNVALGTLTVGLVFVLARRIFDRRVAFVAAAIAACYRMAFFYEGMLVVANVLMPITLVVVLTTLRVCERPTLGRAALAGVAAGIAALARQNLLLYPPLAIGWILWSLHGTATLARRGALAAAIGAGALLAVLPATLHNYAVSRDLVWINSAGGAPFFTGNNPDADGTFRVPRLFHQALADDPVEQREAYASLAEQALGRELHASEVSAFWVDLSLDWIRARPLDWLKLEARKFLLYWNAHEVWNNRTITIDREFSWVLRAPLPTFGLVAPLALLGMGLAARRTRDLFPLYAMIAVSLATALAFFVLSRYRMPVVPLLVIFAGFALVRIVEFARARRVRPLLACALALVGLAGFVHLDVVREDLSVAHYNLANRYKASQQWELAVEHYWKALEGRPSYLSAYNNLALVYEATGHHDQEAAHLWQELRRLALERELPVYVERAERRLRGLGLEEQDPRPE